MHKFIIFILAMTLIFPAGVFARVGVGINRGEIRIEKALKAGGIYDLPVLTVSNTGDEPGNYGVQISYHAERSELRPLRAWFTFNPSRFYLEPGKSKPVSIKVTLPVKIQPGNYFSYLEASPVSGEDGGTSMGVAVGARLFFTVIPSSVWQAVLFRISSFWLDYSPWTWVVLAVMLAAVPIAVFRSRFAFQFEIKKKTKTVKKNTARKPAKIRVN